MIKDFVLSERLILLASAPAHVLWPIRHS